MGQITSLSVIYTEVMCYSHTVFDMYIASQTSFTGVLTCKPRLFDDQQIFANDKRARPGFAHGGFPNLGPVKLRVAGSAEMRQY